MATEIVSQEDLRRERSKEWRRCQARAILNEIWGPAEGAKPKLMLLQGGKGIKLNQEAQP